MSVPSQTALLSACKPALGTGGGVLGKLGHISWPINWKRATVLKNDVNNHFLVSFVSMVVINFASTFEYVSSPVPNIAGTHSKKQFLPTRWERNDFASGFPHQNLPQLLHALPSFRICSILVFCIKSTVTTVFPMLKLPHIQSASNNIC